MVAIVPGHISINLRILNRDADDGGVVVLDLAHDADVAGIDAAGQHERVERPVRRRDGPDDT